MAPTANSCRLSVGYLVAVRALGHGISPVGGAASFMLPLTQHLWHAADRDLGRLGRTMESKSGIWGRAEHPLEPLDVLFGGTRGGRLSSWLVEQRLCSHVAA